MTGASSARLRGLFFDNWDVQGKTVHRHHPWWADAARVKPFAGLSSSFMSTAHCQTFRLFKRGAASSILSPLIPIHRTRSFCTREPGDHLFAVRHPARTPPTGIPLGELMSTSQEGGWIWWIDSLHWKKLIIPRSLCPVYTMNQQLKHSVKGENEKRKRNASTEHEQCE